MDGQTNVYHVSRCPARAASLGHARARLIVVSPVIGLTKASPRFALPASAQKKVERLDNWELSPTRNRSIDFFHREFTFKRTASRI